MVSAPASITAELEPARPRSWGNASIARAWCHCPHCDDLAFHLMPVRHGYRLTRECQACGKTWREHTEEPEAFMAAVHSTTVNTGQD